MQQNSLDKSKSLDQIVKEGVKAWVKDLFSEVTEDTFKPLNNAVQCPMCGSRDYVIICCVDKKFVGVQFVKAKPDGQ